MIAKTFSVLTGFLAVLCVSSAAFAVDQLPLPNASITIASAEVQEFTGDAGKAAHDTACAALLPKSGYLKNDDKIKAIRDYRQCRADRTLSKLAVWRWQDNTPN